MSLLDEFPHTVTIQVRRNVSDGLGGDVESWVTVRTLTNGAWVQVASASEIKEYEKRGMKISYMVYFNEDPLIDETNQVLYGNKVLELGAVSEDSVGFDIVWKAPIAQFTNHP